MSNTNVIFHERFLNFFHFAKQTIKYNEMYFSTLYDVIRLKMSILYVVLSYRSIDYFHMICGFQNFKSL